MTGSCCIYCKYYTDYDRMFFACSSGECPAGTFISDGDTCVECPQGTYQDLPRQTDCKPCGDQKNTQGPGATKQTDCTGE